MKIFLKEVVYFEIEVSDGTDRQRISEAFSGQIRPQFENLLKSIKFDDSDRAALLKLTGTPAKIRLLSRNQFLKETATNRET